MIEEYFKNYTNQYHEMKKALKRYVDAKTDFYHLTGIKYDDMPKAKGKVLGLDDLMINVEQLNNDYLIEYKKYEEEKEKCKKDINKLEHPIHKAIIEYAYLNFEDNKTMAYSLKEYHNKNYSLGYVKILKTRAVAKFEKIITKYNLI